MINRILKLAVSVAVILPMLVVHAQEKPAKESMRIGVLALRGKTATLKSWTPTAAHIEHTVSGRRFEIIPLLLDEAELAVQERTIDFLITNAGQYAYLENKYGVSRIATLRNLRQGKPYTRFGAVVFTRADRADINTLEDLKGRSFMAVSKKAYGGFQMAWYEMQKHGINPFEDFARLEFSGLPQTQIPRAVLQGKVDAGTVRTDILERMAANGHFKLSQFKILNPRKEAGFPFLLSTDLYPEWPFARLPHVSEQLVSDVRQALLLVRQDSAAARSANSAGWAVPPDYSTTHQMMKTLGVGQYSDTELHWAIRFLRDYWIVLLVLVIISIPPAWYYVYRLYIEARDAQRQQKQAETEWLQGMDMLSDPTMLLDLDDRIVRANRAFYSQIDRAPEDTNGHKVTELFHPDAQGIPCAVCLAHQSLQDGVITIEADDPQNRHGWPMQISIRVVRDADGQPLRVIKSTHDLTEVRAREQALKQENRILEQIVRGTVRTTEDNYLQDLVKVVAETLGVDYAFVTEIVDPGQVSRVNAFARWGTDHYLPPLEYELAGTPCEGVVGKAMCFYRDNVQQAFPDDRTLAALDVRGYLGVPISDSAGRPLGHIAVMHRKPISEHERTSAIMQIFADRVGAEIERKHSVDQLEKSEQRFKGLFDTAPDPTIIVNERGKIVLANSRFAEQFGYSKDEITGQPVEILIPEEFRRHHPHMRNAYMAQPVARDMGNRPELFAVRKDGSRFSAEISLSPMEAFEGTYITAVIRDVTDQKLAERELERLASFPMMSPIPVMEVDLNGRVVYENPVSSRLFPDLQEKGYKHPLLEGAKAVLKDLQNGERSVVRDVSVDGAIYEQQLSFVAESERLRIYSWDVTSLHELSKQMHHQATHDALTGLMNRREFEQNLERSIQSAVFQGKRHVLCYIDLDQFKLVNDLCGHSAGDELLRQLTALLKRHVRDSDHLARLGGDEFGLLLVGCPMERATELADRLRQVIADFVLMWENQSFRVGASIGLVEISQASGSLSEVMSAADSACYAAKDLGRNRIFVYHPDDAVVSRNVAEMNWTSRIRQALEQNEFVLFYQTIESLKNKNEVHCEILVRMIDQEGQLILPGAFIPAAERFGLMAEVDQWVISHGLDIISRDQDGFASYSINLSGQTLGNPSVMNWIVDIVSDSDVEAEKICFEITETMMISNLSSAERYIRILRGMGCKFALDDFGTGLSSFSYLKNLPVDRLKIDSHFVRDIADDDINVTMVKSINMVGQAMKLKLVAEGVEDPRTIPILREIGIDYAQGYAISKPILLGGQCVQIEASPRAAAQ